eukprot:NODE_1052_length_1142_cov_591.777676_g800_i0.p1 GENE.NODE_1052_length_1142_cov_591.777676_g800_i0~~NODE_1052_length_1142_cov_591.777676_g800_i0.p1  ORF type:complete len:340 (+),score=108.13 NODE_1052_length_1142_cov_591.777676_g800_i0:60-1022(+)
MSVLDCLKKYTTIVADTANFALIDKYKPQDSTTNPSLLFAAMGMPQYAGLVDEAVTYGKQVEGDVDAKCEAVGMKLAVLFGREILKIVPGRVSTEVDARLSFDTEKTLAYGRKIIALYQELGIPKERILIKIASTWEGIRAAETLEKEGIACNLTLLFSFAQAVACAEAGVTLISPFVGRILDWYKKAEPSTVFSAENDPGVFSVSKIYNYYKCHNYKTIVMGASFRNTGEIKGLCGCDYLTISPALLEELQNEQGEVSPKLSVAEAQAMVGSQKIIMTEQKFRWMHNEDAMGTEKLAEGIRGFTKDTLKLEDVIRSKLG